MSFAEEEMYDMYDPQYEEEQMVENLEKYWRVGKHRDGSGKLWKIKEMTTFHLQNTIKMFEDRGNVSRLLKELKNRTLC